MGKKKSGQGSSPTLKAEAVAKLEVQATVPKASVGRFVDAVTDLFRPFSESQGLKADQIRLQREDVAIEIAKKARERIALEKVPIQPVPNKVLVPLIEAASLEDIDDSSMLEMWGNLLASAATGHSVEPRLVGILKELRKPQAELLERIALNMLDQAANGKRATIKLEGAPFNLRPAIVSEHLTSEFSQAGDELTPDLIYDLVLDEIDTLGCLVDDIILEIDEESWSLPLEGDRSDLNQLYIHAEILTSLGLCRSVHLGFEPRDGQHLTVMYYSITELGIHLLRACSERVRGLFHRLKEPPTTST
jgi:hypothetical protein